MEKTETEELKKNMESTFGSLQKELKEWMKNIEFDRHFQESDGKNEEEE